MTPHTCPGTDTAHGAGTRPGHQHWVAFVGQGLLLLPRRLYWLKKPGADRGVSGESGTLEAGTVTGRPPSAGALAAGE